MSFTDSLPQSADVLVQRSKTDVQTELNKIPNKNRANVFLPSSWLGAIPTASANRLYDYTLTLQEAIRLNMPDTATDDYADRWGSIYVGARNAAVGATGYLIATGTVGSTIPALTNFLSSNGITYQSNADATIAANTISITSITRIGTIATVTTASDHNLSSKVPVTISGAAESQYNGTKSIQVTGSSTFTFSVAGSPATPSVGTKVASYNSIKVFVAAVPPADPSQPFGEASNQTLDTPLNVSIVLSGIDGVAYVGFDGLAGGTDRESDVDYKSRYISRIQNPVAHFNEQDIDQTIKNNVPGVTRTFIQKSGKIIGVQSISSITRVGQFAIATTSSNHDLFNAAGVTITGAVQPEYNVTLSPILVLSPTSFAYVVSGTPVTPATGTISVSKIIPLGRVAIYFTRDNDDTPIPSAGEVTDVLNSVLSITPANTPNSYVLVAAPTPLAVNFTLTELTPNTLAMRNAVLSNLTQFFKESTSVGVNVDQDAYRSAIFNTSDPNTGAPLISFDLSAPVGDIAVSSNVLPVLGTVTFP